jgi:hypothetical protein
MGEDAKLVFVDAGRRAAETIRTARATGPMRRAMDPHCARRSRPICSPPPTMHTWVCDGRHSVQRLGPTPPDTHAGLHTELTSMVQEPAD